MTIVIAPRIHDIGGFEVRRAVPTLQARSVGPFVFVDHMGPVVLDRGTRPVLRAKTPLKAMLLGGEPLDGARHLWWNFVSSSKDRIEQAKQDWVEGRFGRIPGEHEFIPHPDR